MTGNRECANVMIARVGRQCGEVQVGRQVLYRDALVGERLAHVRHPAFGGLLGHLACA